MLDSRVSDIVVDPSDIAYAALTPLCEFTHPARQVLHFRFLFCVFLGLLLVLLSRIHCYNLGFQSVYLTLVLEVFCGFFLGFFCSPRLVSLTFFIITSFAVHTSFAFLWSRSCIRFSPDSRNMLIDSRTRFSSDSCNCLSLCELLFDFCNCFSSTSRSPFSGIEFNWSERIKRRGLFTCI